MPGLLLDGFDPIVFCRFIPTAEYVAEYLRTALGHKAEVAAVTGLLEPADRIARIEALTSARGRHVLVCHRLPVRGRQPAGTLPGGRALRPGLEPDPA